MPDRELGAEDDAAARADADPAPGEQPSRPRRRIEPLSSARSRLRRSVSRRPDDPAGRGGDTARTPVLSRQLAALRVVFASPPLRRCQLTMVLGRTVDLAQLVTVSAYLFTRDGADAVAVYGVVRAIAPAVGVPILVSVTARLGYGRTLGLLAVVGALCSAGMALVVVTDGALAAMLGLAALVHVAIGAFRPVTSALAPSLVRTPEELVACTAATGFLDGATTLAGPVLAGTLLTLAGPDWSLAATGALLGVAAILAAGLPVPRAIAPRAADQDGVGGLRTFFTTPESAVVGVLGLVQTLVRGALYVLLVAFTVQVLARTEGYVGLLLGAIGVGGMLGLPAAMAVVGRTRLYRSFGLGLVLWGAPLVLMAGVPQPGVVLLLLVIIGLGNSIIDISAFTALPRAVPDRVLAQAYGVLESLFQVGMALGAALAGVLVALLDVRLALLLVGLLLPVGVLLAAPWLRRFDARLVARDLEVDLLRRQSLFADLPMPVLDTVAGRLEPASFEPDEVIMRQGDLGDRYVLIARGTVTIARDGLTVAQLDSGDAFGEIALVRDSPRTATAVAATPVLARTLDRDSFLAALGCDPRARAAAEEITESRSRPARRSTPS